RLSRRPAVDRLPRARPPRPGAQRLALRHDREHRRRPRRARACPPADRRAGGGRRRGERVAAGRAFGLGTPVKYVATIAGTATVVDLAGGDGHYRLTIGD